jgi:protein O-mannosyl-transferase
VKAQKLIPLLVVAAGLLVYYNSFEGPFIFDDVASIPQNPTIRHLWPIWQPLSSLHRRWTTVEGRPIVNLSLAINYALGGLDVRGYHALNLGVHILAGLALLGVARRTLLQPRLRERFGAAANELAMATAVIWTVHPLQTEAVTYIIQRAESIVGLFYLLTLYCFVRGAESRRPRAWYGLCLGACALGMATKETMVFAPVLVMLYDRAFVSGSLRESWRRHRPLYIGLAGTWILLGYLVLFAGSFSGAVALARSGGITWWEYLLTEPGVILHYLRLAAWPDSLCFDYFGWPIARTWLSILPPAVVMAILLGATAWAWRTNSVWGVLGAWFFLILAPSSSFIPLDSPAYEHRMHLPLAAVIVAAVIGIHALLGRRSMVVFLAMAVGLGFLTTRRNEDYRSELSIWADTVLKRPQNPRAHNNLGETLSLAGRLGDAIWQYQQALQLDPQYAIAHNNWGNALIRAGNVSEAISQYQQALWIKPDYAEAHNNMGNALIRLGKRLQAMEQFEQALQIKPDLAEAHNNVATALEQAGRLQDAIGHYERALQIRPDSAAMHCNLANALFRAGRMPEAIAQYEEALRIKPDYAEASYNLRAALEQQARSGAPSDSTSRP